MKMNSKHGNVTDIKDGLSERQDRILDAAKTCFVRSGFDRTTMMEIAREAKMSSPNIYRYFPSKEALVLGLAARDGKHYASIIEPLNQPGAGAAELVEVFTRYFEVFDRESALLRLDLWLNATRSESIAEIEKQGESTSNKWLFQTLESLSTSPDCDPQAILNVINPLLKGITLSIALVPDFDPGPALVQVRNIIEDGLSGRKHAVVHRQQKER